MKNIHIPTIDELMTPDSPINKLTNGNYLFTRIPYQGRVLEKIEFCPKYLEKGACKTQEAWNKFSKKNKIGWNAADTEILYQCLLRAYAMRSDAQHQETVQELRKDMQEILNPSEEAGIITLTTARFGSGLDAVISSLGPGKKDTPLTLPEFTKSMGDWCYLILAPEQPEKDLGKILPLPSDARPIMKALLGKGYAQAGAVFQYFSTLKNGNLRETRLWTPSATNRIQSWVVTLNVNSTYRFALSVGVNIDGNGPALGVR